MFDYKPEYTKELLRELENIENEEIREIAKQSAHLTILSDIAEEFDKTCDDGEIAKEYKDFCKNYPLAECSLGIVVSLSPRYLRKYILHLVFDICKAVEDVGYECGVDDGYDKCGKEMREEIESEVKQEYKEKFDCSGKEASHKIEQLRNERDKANKHAENVGESLLRKTYELIRTKEKLKENEDFIQFMKDEIPDVYKKLSKEYRNRKEMEEN